jgi:hypothetical protein
LNFKKKEWISLKTENSRKILNSIERKIKINPKPLLKKIYQKKNVSNSWTKWEDVVGNDADIGTLVKELEAGNIIIQIAFS